MRQLGYLTVIETAKVWNVEAATIHKIIRQGKRFSPLDIERRSGIAYIRKGTEYPPKLNTGPKPGSRRSEMPTPMKQVKLISRWAMWPAPILVCKSWGWMGGLRN